MLNNRAMHAVTHGFNWKFCRYGEGQNYVKKIGEHAMSIKTKYDSTVHGILNNF